MTEDVLELAEELIRYETVSPVTDPAVFHVLADLLDDHGIDSEIHEVNGVYSLTARTGSGRPRICLNGHLDVVEPGNGWTVTGPFQPVVEDGKLYGRGAADMKTAVAAQVMAFIDLHRDGFDGTATLMVVGDEELGGFNGTEHLVETLPRFDYAIIGEPTGFDVQVGARGVLWIDVVLSGASAHASRPGQGVNAVRDLPGVLEALQSLDLSSEPDDALPAPTAPVTVVETEGSRNTVPGAVRVGLDVRYTLDMSAETVEEDVRRALDPLDVEYEMHLMDHGAAYLLTDERFRDIVTETIEEVRGTTPAHVTAGGSSDGRFFAATGAPFVEVGVDRDPIHREDEYCAVADLPDLREVYRRAAKRLAATS